MGQVGESGLPREREGSWPGKEISLSPSLELEKTCSPEGLEKGD